MALTATARQNTQIDIVNHLSIPNCKVFISSHNRPNLFYEVRREPASDEKRFQEVVQFIKSKHNGKSGIVYFNARVKCEKFAERFRAAGISAEHYHAMVGGENKDEILRRWVDGKTKVVCATVGFQSFLTERPCLYSAQIAFGMGVDKPDGMYYTSVGPPPI
jgi:bloom syndrome protein